MSDNRARRAVAIVVLVVNAFGSTAALAQEPRAGVVTTVEGQALLARPTLSQPVSLKFKDDLFARDRIETRENSIARVLLGGKAVVTIRELSVFTVTEEPGRAAVDLRSGRLAVGVAKSLLKPGEVIEIRTPNAVAGIRGSLLVAEVADVGGVPQSVFTALQATLPITIASRANPSLAVSLNPDQAVSVSGAGAAATLGPVQNITPAQAQRAAAIATAPRPAEQGASSPLGGQITSIQVAQATELASLVAPSSASPLKMTGLVAVVSPPTTADIGVNETEAGVVAEAVETAKPDVPDITIQDTTRDVPPGETLKVYTGTSSRTGTSPVVVISNSQVSSPGSLLAVAPGADSSLNGPLLEMSGSPAQASTLTVGASVVDIQGRLSDGTAAPLLQFDTTSVVSGNAVASVNTGGALSLAGPAVSATGTAFSVGDPTSNTLSFFAVLDGSTVTSASPSPLLSFDGSSVDTSGNIVVIRRSPSTTLPSTLTLSGPLLSAVNGSSFNTSSLGLGAACCSLVSVTQGGRLVATTTSPLVHISGSTVHAGPDAQSGGSIINLSDTFTNAPSAELVAPAAVSLAGPLLSVDNSTVTALFHLLRVGNSSLTSTSPDPLIQISGSTVTLGGTDPFTHATSAARVLNLSMSGSDTPASLTLSGPLFSAVNSTLRSTSELVGIFGGTLTTTGTADPLISLAGGTVTSGTHLIHVVGSSSGVSVPTRVDLSDPLLSVSGSSINVRGNLVRIVDGASLSSTTTSPLISFQGGSYTGGPFQSNTGASLLRMFSQVGQPGSVLSLAGPYIAASGAAFTSPDAPPFNIADGSIIASTGPTPFASFTGGSLTTQSSFFNVDTNTTIAGTPPTVGNGEPARVSISGTLLRGTDTTFTTQNGGTFFRLNNDVSLTQTGTSAPLLDFVGSSSGGTVVTAAGNFAVLTAAAERQAPTLSLGGPWLNAVNTAFTNGNPTSSTNNFIFVGNGAQVIGASPAPLLFFDHSSVDTSGGLFGVQRSASVSLPSTVTLAGPLFSAVNQSSFNTSSLGSGSSRTCCDTFFISQGGLLSSTTDLPLIQLANSTLSAGPDAQSGGDVIGLFDTFSGAPASELVAPALVTLAGPLLSASGSAITALFSLLSINRSLLLSSSPDPLIQLDGSTLSVGGTNPFTNATTSGRVLNLVGSDTTLGILALNGPLFRSVNSTVTSTSDTVGVFNGGVLLSTTANPLISINGGTVTAGTSSVTGRLLNLSSSIGVPAALILAGPLFSAVNATITTTADTLGIFSGGALVSTSGSALVEIGGSTVTAGTSSVSGRVLNLNGSSAPATLALAGPLFTSVNSTVSTTVETFGIFNGGVLTSASASPLISVSGGSVTAGTSGNFVSMFSGEGFPPTSMTLAGPLLSATNATLKNGDPTSLTFRSFVGLGGSAQLTSTGSAPLLAFDHSTVDTSGGMFNQNGGAVTLAGPLLSSSGSSFDTTSLVSNSGPTPFACCNAFDIRGAFTSTTTAPLFQLAGSTFNGGPDAQSGGGFFSLSNAPMQIAGPLLSATDSTITVLFNFLNVTRASLTSTTTAPFLQLGGSTSTLNAGGTNPIGNTASFGRLLNVVGSNAPGTVGQAASVSLAGPFLSATSTSLSAANQTSVTAQGGVIVLFNGATLTDTGSAPLIQLSNSKLTVGTSAVDGYALALTETGGPSGSGLSTASLAGPLLRADAGSALNLSAGLMGIFAGGQVIETGTTDPFVSLNGGTHAIATNDFRWMYFLQGQSTHTAVDPESGLTLGTDRPIRGTAPTQPIATPLLELTAAAVTGQGFLRVDTALLEATAPLLNLKAGSVMTSSRDAITLLSGANVSSNDLVRLDASVLNVNGALANIGGGSKLTVGGNFLSLNNGATLSSGLLLSVSGGSFAKIGGALVSFGGSGGNLVNVTNNLAPTGFLAGVPVFSSLGGTNGFTLGAGSPLVGLNSLGTIRINNSPLPTGATSSSGVTGSLIAIQGSGSVKLGH